MCQLTPSLSSSQNSCSPPVARPQHTHGPQNTSVANRKNRWLPSKDDVGSTSPPFRGFAGERLIGSGLELTTLTKMHGVHCRTLLPHLHLALRRPLRPISRRVLRASSPTFRAPPTMILLPPTLRPRVSHASQHSPNLRLMLEPTTPTPRALRVAAPYRRRTSKTAIPLQREHYQ